MSQYLIDQLAQSRNISVEAYTKVVSVHGADCLEAISTTTNEKTLVQRPADALFVMIGARAGTDWLPEEVQRDVNGFICTGRDIEQSLADGGCDVPWIGGLQSRASMYGFITFATRQTLAACHRSSTVALWLLMDSRRASSATSRPILFRYLKQSATVFATEKTRSGTPSTSWVAWPKSSDCFENRTIRNCGISETGRRSFSPIAIQTSKGLSVPMSWNRSADSRQITARGARFGTCRAMNRYVIDRTRRSQPA